MSALATTNKPKKYDMMMKLKTPLLCTAIALQSYSPRMDVENLQCQVDSQEEWCIK